MEGPGLAELEERAGAAEQERRSQASAAERDLVVTVEDAEDGLEIERGRRDPRQLGTRLAELLLAEEPDQHGGRIRLGDRLAVEMAQEAEAHGDLAEAQLGAERERQEREIGLGQRCFRLARAVLELLRELEPEMALGVRVDPSEQVQLDLSREEAVLTPREGPALGVLHVALREAAGEIGDDPDIEEELPGPAPLVERERLARAREVGERDPRRRWRHCGRLSSDRRGRSRLRLDLEPLQALGERLELLPQGFDLLSERFRFLCRGRSSGKDDAQ